MVEEGCSEGGVAPRLGEEQWKGIGRGRGGGLPLEIQGRGVATRVDGATLKVQGSSTCSGRARKKGKVEREREGRGLPLEIQGRGVATRVDGATLKMEAIWKPL